MGASIFASVHPQKKSYQLFCQPTLPTTSSTYTTSRGQSARGPTQRFADTERLAMQHVGTQGPGTCDRREVIHSHCLFRHLMLPEFLFHKQRMQKGVKNGETMVKPMPEVSALRAWL